MRNKLTAVLAGVICFVLMVPFVGTAKEYAHKLQVEDMEFQWTIEGDQIHVQVSAKTTGWVGIGFDPEKAMMGANIIIGAVKKGKARIEDHYGDRRVGHSPDEKLGGADNITDKQGWEKDGVTTLAFTIPLDSGDKYDKPIKPQGKYTIMLAYGPPRDRLTTRHPYRTVYEIDFSTGENKKIK